MKKAGSREAFKTVDFGLVADVARKAYHAGIKRIIVVSFIRANPMSSNFYLRTKGQLGKDLKKFNLELVAYVRPSILLGKRNEFIFGESFGI